MVNLPNIIKQMSQLKHFAGLSLADIDSLVRAGHTKKFEEGQIIAMEEEPCSGLFVLLKGQIHLYRLGPDGQVLLMEIVRPIKMFNEVSILDGGPNSLTAIAAKDSIVWNADYEILLKLSERYPQVALGFLPVVAARHRALVSMVTDVCFRSVRGRTAKLLLDLSNYGKKPIVRRDHTIYEMSSQVSTVPEAISRSLTYFKHEGHILSSRTSIIVCEPEQLARLAQIDVSAEPTKSRLS